MLSTKTVLAALALTTVAALATTGCAARNGAQLASDTSGSEDVASTESDVESLGTSFVGGDGQSVATQSLVGGGDLKVMGAGATVGVPGFSFQPAGCLQVSEDKAHSQATYTFNGCTGPLGLVELNGTITVDWQLAATDLTLSFSAQGFKINRATIDSWQATAVITPSGDQRSMTWNATLSGTTGSGRQFNRTNQKSVQWTVGVECLSASGQSSGDIRGANLQTNVISWQRCADACPQAGSEISVKNLDKGDSIDIKYDGGPTAQLTLDGKSSDIRLACGE